MKMSFGFLVYHLISCLALAPFSHAKDVCMSVGKVNSDGGEDCSLTEGDAELSICISSKPTGPKVPAQLGTYGEYIVQVKGPSGKVLRSYRYNYLTTEGAAGTTYRTYSYRQQAGVNVSNKARIPPQLQIAQPNAGGYEEGAKAFDDLKFSDGTRYCAPFRVHRGKAEYYR